MAARFVCTGTQTGDGLDHPPTGRHFRRARGISSRSAEISVGGKQMRDGQGSMLRRGNQAEEWTAVADLASVT